MKESPLVEMLAPTIFPVEQFLISSDIHHFPSFRHASNSLHMILFLSASNDVAFTYIDAKQLDQE